MPHIPHISNLPHIPHMPHMPHIPHIPRPPKLSSITPPCLPTVHLNKNHNEGSGSNPLDVQDARQNVPNGIPVLVRQGSTSSQGPINNFFARWPDNSRGHVIAMFAELIGTTTFLFFAFAAAQVANEKPDTLSRNQGTGPSLLQIIFIAWTFGISLAVNVWIFYRVSGGMFNPAVGLPTILVCSKIACIIDKCNRWPLDCGLQEPSTGSD